MYHPGTDTKHPLHTHARTLALLPNPALMHGTWLSGLGAMLGF